METNKSLKQLIDFAMELLKSGIINSEEYDKIITLAYDAIKEEMTNQTERFIKMIKE